MTNIIETQTDRAVIVENTATNVIETQTERAVVTENTATNVVQVVAAGPAGPPGGSITAQENGVDVGLIESKLNFTGSVEVTEDTLNNAIVVNVTGSGGTVTSVNVSGGTTGLTFTGGPITESGTITAGGTLALANGGTGATTAANARTNLGAAASGANSDITSLSGITGAISTVDYVAFDTTYNTAPTAGSLAWNSTDGTLDIGLNNGSVLQVGQEMMFYAKNTSGSTITNGTPVMFTGAVGASGALTFGPAVADGSVPADYMMGVATQDIANNAFGYITTFGLVRGINATGSAYGETWADGDLLYFDPATPGTWTNVKPVAPNLHLPVAVVVNAGSGGSGSIFVRMQVSNGINSLQDVYINGTGTPLAGDTLIYDAAQNRWENHRLTAGSGVSITNGNGSISIANSAPDQVVSLTGAGTTSISGSYPNFTITSNDEFDGTVTSVALSAGSGISVSGGPITSSGTITVTNTAPDQVVSITGGTGISASGTYPNFTITNSSPDQVVSLTGAGTTVISGTYPNFTITSNDEFDGTVTSVAASGGTTGLTFSGGPITSSGTLTLGGTLAIANGGTSATTAQGGRLALLPSITGQAGKILAVNVGETDYELISAGGTGTVTSVDLTAGTGISVSGGPITSAGSITVTNTAPDQVVSLTGAGTAVVTGTYPNFTITTNDEFDGTVTSVGLTAGSGISVSGGPITSSGSITVTNTAPDQIVSLTGAGTTAITGTYPNFTITSNDQFDGTVTSVNLTAGTGMSVSGGPITSSGSITVTNTAPDQIVSLTGAGTTSISGTYPNFTITSNDEFDGTVTSVGITAGTGITVSGGPITSSGSITVTNSAPDQVVSLTAGTGISATGTYPNFTIANTAPDQTVSLTEGSGITITGTYPNFTIAAEGGSMVYPGAGIAVSTGSAWGTSLTAPTGAIVGTTDTQTLTNKTITNLVFDGDFTEEVFAITDGASVDLDPSNGTIQTWTLGANRTPTANSFSSGQSMTLMIADGSAYAVTWGPYVAPTIVGSTSQSFGSSTTGNLTLPSGLQAGDVVIVGVGSDDGTSIGLPSGWTNINNSTSGAEYSRTFYKVMGTTPDTTVALTGLGTATAAVSVAVRGANVSGLVSAVATGTTGMPNAPSVSVSAVPSFVLAFGYLDDDNVASSVTAPSGYTLLQSVQSTTTGQTVMVAYAQADTETSYDPGAFGGTGTDDWVAVSVVLPPSVVNSIVNWVGGTAPALATTGYSVIELWKVGSTLYGAYVGDVA